MKHSNTTQERWTLAELTARVAIALTEADIDQQSARVRDVPNARTIRYYTTIGLLDRPLAFRGRTALYGRRHLLQIVAIKRLQARGEALEAVQQRLLGLTDEALAAMAGPVTLTVSDDTDEAEEEVLLSAQSRRQGAFWEAAPAPVSPGPGPGPVGGGAGVARGGLVQGVALGGGVTLVLGAGVRALDAHDLESIEAAAAPLMKLLGARRLLDKTIGEE
jgi:DNA-binding transcriptional MerR regulator